MIAELRNRLNQELEGLVAELTVEVPARVGADRARDELADGEAQQQIERRIQFLHHTLSALDTVEPAMIPADGIGFGSTVGLRDLRTGAEFTYTLMIGDAVNLDAGEISIASPVGYALVGRKEGDEVQVDTPMGRRHFRIVAVTTLQEEISRAAPALKVRCA
jgi:transcription elongation factor GreA